MLNDASHLPPPVPEMKTALGDLELYLHRADDSCPLLVRLAFIHYQFEAIHPFVDGNGRIGRLLLALLLVEWGLLPLPLLYLSAYFERNREAYYAGLSAVSKRGAWREWVVYFLSGVREQSLDAVVRLRKLADLREQWREQAMRVRHSAVPVRLVEQLFETPTVTIAMIGRRLGITYPSAKRNVLRMVGAGVLQPLGEATYGQAFGAMEIFRLLEEE